jgi:hypothetical protein
MTQFQPTFDFCRTAKDEWCVGIAYYDLLHFAILLDCDVQDGEYRIRTWLQRDGSQGFILERQCVGGKWLSALREFGGRLARFHHHQNLRAVRAAWVQLTDRAERLAIDKRQLDLVQRSRES